MIFTISGSGIVYWLSVIILLCVNDQYIEAELPVLTVIDRMQTLQWTALIKCQGVWIDGRSVEGSTMANLNHQNIIDRNKGSIQSSLIHGSRWNIWWDDGWENSSRKEGEVIKTYLIVLVFLFFTIPETKITNFCNSYHISY